jgi:hypothetical protein
VAIESLAESLAKALETKVHYGVFECFLHRSLLWQRAQNASLKQIDYPDGKAVPSWSCMAYDGQVLYLPLTLFGEIVWDRSVQLVAAKASDGATSTKKDSCILEARVRRLRDCEIRPEGAEGIMLDKEDNGLGQLYLDTKPEVRCAIMGREKSAEDGNRMYYVLFVTKCATSLSREKFRRVGMGSIQQRFIMFDSEGDTAQIL